MNSTTTFVIMNQFWYIDFEAYKVNDTFYVKEIAILKNDRTECWTYHISHHGTTLPTSPDFRQQQSQLLLAWSYGEYNSFDQVIDLLKAKIGNNIVIFSSANNNDTAKYKFLKNFIPHLTEQPYEFGFEMINCKSEKCDVTHGNCARQRVYELRYCDYHNIN